MAIRSSASFFYRIQHQAWIGILLAVALLYAWLSRYYYVGMLSDDAMYVLGAQSLLKGAYVAQYAIAQPSRPFYPPGWPLFLAPFVACVRPHWDALKAVVIALMLLNGALTYNLARTWLPESLSLAAVALFLFNPAVVYSSCLVMSEPLLITIFLLGFILLRRMTDHERTWHLWALGGLLGYAIIVRYTGIALSVAVLAAEWVRGRRRQAVQMGCIASIIPAIVGMANFIATRQLTGYTSAWKTTVTAIASPLPFFMQWLQATHMVFVNDVLSIPLPDTPLGFFMRSFLALCVVCIIAANVKALERVPRGARALTLAGIALVGTWYGIHIFWWPTYSRYALPTLPFVCIFILSGCLFLYKRSTKLLRPAWLLILCLIVFCYAQADRSFIRRVATFAPMWRPPVATTQWIREHTPSEALFLYVKPAELYLLTGHKSVDYETTKNIEHFRYLMLKQHVRYIWSRPFRTSTHEYKDWTLMGIWSASWREAFKNVYDNPQEASVIYEVMPDPAFLKAYELYARATGEFDSSQFEEGLVTLQEALRVDPHLLSALNAYGAVCAMTGKDLKAGEIKLLKALQLSPGHPLVLLNLSRLYSKMGDQTQARKRLNEAALAAAASYEFDSLLPIIRNESRR